MIKFKSPGRHYPTFIEIGTNRARINHRRGSNVVNGEYYWDYNDAKPITHYSQWRNLDVEALRRRYIVAERKPFAVEVRSPLLRRAISVCRSTSRRRTSKSRI